MANNITFWEMETDKPFPLKFMKKVKEWNKNGKHYNSYFVVLQDETTAFFVIGQDTFSTEKGKKAYELIEANLYKDVVVKKVKKGMYENLEVKPKNNYKQKNINVIDKSTNTKIPLKDVSFYVTKEEMVLKGFLKSLNKLSYDDLEAWVVFEEITKTPISNDRLIELFKNRNKEWVVKWDF